MSHISRIRRSHVQQRNTNDDEGWTENEWDQTKADENNTMCLPVATDVKVYFCDPQSAWQRGTNENTSGLLRQYFPKRTDLSGYSQSELDKVALRLNQRPRKTLGFETPASRQQPSVASTY